ncbi:MAG: helix-turn-helix domain-containing protein [Hyphomicrobium sp.]
MTIARLSPAERIIAWRLTERRLVPDDEITVALWGSRADGGAEHTRNIIGVLVHRLRQKLEPFGVKVINEFGRGYRVPREQQARLLDVLADEIARNTPGRGTLTRFTHSDREELRP